MEDHVEISMLMDFYGSLLTEKQLDIMMLYYNENLSLAEISEITNTSRQAIHDIIRRCNKSLIDYEEKLRLKESSLYHGEMKKSVLTYLTELKKEFSNPIITAKVDKIEEIIKLL